MCRPVFAGCCAAAHKIHPLHPSPRAHQIRPESYKRHSFKHFIPSACRFPRAGDSASLGADGTIARLPTWSSNGDRIVFESVGSGTVKLAVKSASGGGGEEMLFESPQGKIPCDWSPDGRYLLYYVPDPKTGTDLWVLPTETRKPFLFLQTDANELWGRFSPDGRWVAYQSNETGRYEIYVRAFPVQGGPIPVSSAGGVYPRWSRNGKDLYFIAPDARLMAAPMSTRRDAGQIAAATRAASSCRRRCAQWSSAAEDRGLWRQPVCRDAHHRARRRGAARRRGGDIRRTQLCGFSPQSRRARLSGSPRTLRARTRTIAPWIRIRPVCAGRRGGRPLLSPPRPARGRARIR